MKGGVIFLAWGGALAFGAVLLGCSGAGRGEPGAAARAPAGEPEAEEIHFVDVTEASGVRFVHNAGAFGERWLPETMGPGVIVLNADSDDDPDLLFVNGTGFPGRPGEATTPALYLGREGVRFDDATRQAGLDFSAYCLGGAAGDIDNDGDHDVYLACLGTDYLLRNEGGRFEDVSEAAGLSRAREMGAAAVFFDADRDGFLDIYTTRYVSWTPEEDVVCSTGQSAKVYCTPGVYRGAPQRFYRNLGDGTFEDSTESAGLAKSDGKMLGVVPFDADGDGWTDLAVAGDTHANLLYRNLGDGTFEEIGLIAGVGLSQSGGFRGGMGISAGDYDRSGRQSLAISYFANDPVSLYRNIGGASFLDLGSTSEIGRRTYETLGWGCFFFDYDLDGWLDFLVANGHLDDDRTTPHAQPQQLFRNLGRGMFEDVTESAGGDLARPVVGRGAAYADMDADGDLDVVLAVNRGAAKVFENRGRAHGNWLRVELEGTVSNRNGLGAEITVRSAGGTQSRFVHGGGSYLSQSQIAPTFGLGGDDTVDEVAIRWPSDTLQRLENQPVNRVIRAVEPASP